MRTVDFLKWDVYFFYFLICFLRRIVAYRDAWPNDSEQKQKRLSKVSGFIFNFFWLIWKKSACGIGIETHISGQMVNIELTDRVQNGFKWSQ